MPRIGKEHTWKIIVVRKVHITDLHRWQNILIFITFISFSTSSTSFHCSFFKEVTDTIRHRIRKQSTRTQQLTNSH